LSFVLITYYMTQSGKVMAPFCNKGWKYFDQFQEIMPGSTARGSHAFSAVTTAPPSQEFGDDNDEGGSGRASISCTKGSREEPMDVDKEVDSSTFISASAGKRKLATITSEEDTVASSSDQPQPPSSATSILSRQSSMLSDEPSRKKAAGVASSIASSSQLRSKASSSCCSKGASSIHSSGRASGSKTVAKLSSELVVHKVQGSINSLTATVRNSMSIDPVTKVRQDALRMLQTRDDGLTEDQEVMMYHKIAANHALAQVYLALDKPVLRRKWLQVVLEN
jgi:hypothetical protein